MIWVKNTIITAYCWGLLPAWAVSALFRLFRLKDA